MDETAKLYNLRPTHTYSTSKVRGYKQAKDRLTVAVCANADGSHKYGLYVIGKVKKPRSFPKDWSPRLLGVTWTNNNTAWMNAVAFTQFLVEFDEEMNRRYMGEEVLLLLDNAPSHKLQEDLVLKCTKVLFLPANTTTDLQPMNAGVIATFKKQYKKLSSRAQLQMVIKGHRVSISPYQALCFCKKAWDAVSATAIEKCWYKTVLVPRPVDQANDADIAASIEEEQSQITESIQESLDRIQQLQPNHHVLNAEQFMAADSDLSTESELTLEEAAEAVLSPEPEEDELVSTDVAEHATLPIAPTLPQPSMVSMRNLLDLMHNAHEASMTRTDTNYITEGLWSLIQQAEKKAQQSRSIQPAFFVSNRQ